MRSRTPGDQAHRAPFHDLYFGVPRADRPIMSSEAEKAVGYWRKWQRDLTSALWEKIAELSRVIRQPSTAGTSLAR